MLRSTKIVAPLGPASSSPEALGALIAAGVDVVRLNFSHGTADDHRARAKLVRELSQQHRRPVGILVDLQGPKIRVGKFTDGKITLNKGDTFILDAACKLGNQERVGLDYPELPNDVQAGDVLLLDDGRVVLNVTAVNGPEIHTKVAVGGPLSNNKGINRKGGGLSAPALTDKDKADMITAAEINADFLAISFPREAADIHLSRDLMKKAGVPIVPGTTEPLQNAAEVAALLGGHVDLLFSAYPSLSGAIESKKVTLLANNGPGRSAQAPDAPPVADTIPGFDFAPVIGLFARAGTPDAIIQKIASEVAVIVKQPDVIKQFATAGIEPVGAGPAEYVKVMKGEIDRVAAVVKVAGIKPQ